MVLFCSYLAECALVRSNSAAVPWPTVVLFRQSSLSVCLQLGTLLPHFNSSNTIILLMWLHNGNTLLRDYVNIHRYFHGYSEGLMWYCSTTYLTFFAIYNYNQSHKGQVVSFTCKIQYIFSDKITCNMHSGTFMFFFIWLRHSFGCCCRNIVQQHHFWKSSRSSNQQNFTRTST